MAEKSGRTTRVQNYDPLPITQAFIEIAVMKHPRLSNHPNILQLLGTTDNSFSPRSYNLPLLSLVTEYADLGSLESFLFKQGQTIDWELKTKILDDVAAGLHSIHTCDVVHNDVKCGNILLFSSSIDQQRIVAKISDFGCSVLLAETRPIRKAAATTLFASPESYSPECIVHTARDIYSFGLVILHLATGKQPFVGMKDYEVWECKQSSEEMQDYVLGCIQCLYNSMPSRIMHILLRTLRFNPEERLTDLSVLSLNE